MRALSNDELAAVSGGDTVSPVYVTWGSGGSLYGSAFSVAPNPPTGTGTHPSDHAPPPPIQEEPVEVDWLEVIGNGVKAAFGGYFEIQARDQTSKYDHNKIDHLGEFWWHADKVDITLKLKAEYEADGSFWLDLNDNTKGDTHVKYFSDGFWYDSDNNGTYDTQVTNKTFLISQL